MGWQDRDWAKWNDDERRRFFGSGGSPRSGRHGGFAPGAFLAVVVSLVAVVVGQSQGIDLLHLGRAHASIPIAPLYGTGVVVKSFDGSENVSCTALSFDSLGEAHCAGWTYLVPGERAAPAAGMPARGTCATAEANQISGTWVCTVPVGGSVNG